MAWQLAVIKMKSHWNSLRAQTWVLVLSIIGYVYLLGVGSTIGVGLIAGAARDLALTRPLLGLLGAAFTFGWVLLPIVFSSADDALSPKKLAPFAPPSRRVAFGLLAAAFAGPTGFFLLSACIIQVWAWTLLGGWQAGLVSALGCAIGAITCVSWGRLVVSWAARTQDSRVTQERSWVIAFVIIMLVGVPLLIVLPSLLPNFTAASISTVVNLVGWSPFGAAWTIVDSFTSGQWWVFFGHLAVAVATASAGVALWCTNLKVAMFGRPHRLAPTQELAVVERRHSVSGATPQTKASTRHLAGVDLWGRLGVSGPAAAIAARQQRYWLKDPRLYSQMLAAVAMLLMAVLLPRFVEFDVGPGNDTAAFSVGMSVGMLYFAALISGQVIGTLLQFDSTAFWVQVAGRTRGADDRLGRLLGSVPLVGAVVAAGAAAVGTYLNLGVALTVVTVIAALTVMGCAAAATLTIGAQLIFPAQPPGTNPLSAKSSGNVVPTLLITLLGLLGATIVSAPPLMGLAFAWGHGWVVVCGALLAAVIWTVGTLWVAVVLGGRLLDRSQVDLLTKMASWPGHGAPA